MLKPDTEFAQGLLNDLKSGRTPDIQPGAKGMRPTLAMIAVSLAAALAHSPAEAQQHWLERMANGVSDVRHIKRTGEIVKDSAERIGSNGRSGKDAMLYDIENALRNIEYGRRTAKTVSDRHGVVVGQGSSEPAATERPQGGRPNSELFGPGY